MWRKSTRETELQGERLPEGTRVMYCIAAANRDPTLWDEPDAFRIDRPLPVLRKHLSFASGPHVCAGLQLARMEAGQVFDKLVARLPDLRLTGAPERIEVFNFWGRSRLPVAWG
jgi:cytochrome P450